MIYLSDQHDCVCISLQQIMDLAVIPVLKGLISDIVSTLLDTDAFGYYYVTKMVLTGNFLSQKEQSIFSHIILSEIEKEFKEQMRSRVYEFQVITDLVTSSQKKSIVINSRVKRISFYDTFLRGELRIVANMTYWFGIKSPVVFIDQDKELCNKRVQTKHDHKYPIRNVSCSMSEIKCLLNR